MSWSLSQLLFARVGWCSKLFPVRSKFQMHKGLDSSPRFLIISPRSWKYLVIFTGFVILALVMLNFFRMRIENVGFLLIKLANQSFPEIFDWTARPSFIFAEGTDPAQQLSLRYAHSLSWCLFNCFYNFLHNFWRKCCTPWFSTNIIPVRQRNAGIIQHLN